MRPRPSGIHVSLRLALKAEGIRQPVAVARELFDAGLPLRKAHEAINRVTSGQSYAVSLVASSTAELIDRLDGLGVAASEIRRPDINLKEIRETQNLSQLDFATRYGLDVKNVQNWEQGRYDVDKSTTLLLAIIRDHPQVVDQVLTASREGERKK